MEDWEAANPGRAKLRRWLLYLRVQWLLLLKALYESEHGKVALAKLELEKQRAHDAMLRVYLMLMRLGGCRPWRQRVAALSTRDLVAELVARRIDHSACLERSELLDALCGTEERTEDEPLISNEEFPTSVDKMV